MQSPFVDITMKVLNNSTITINSPVKIFCWINEEAKEEEEEEGVARARPSQNWFHRLRRPPFLHLDVGCRLGGRRTHARSSNDNFSVVDDHRFSARNSFYDPPATTIQLTTALPMQCSTALQNA